MAVVDQVLTKVGHITHLQCRCPWAPACCTTSWLPTRLLCLQCASASWMKPRWVALECHVAAAGWNAMWRLLAAEVFSALLCSHQLPALECTLHDWCGYLPPALSNLRIGV